MIVFALPIQLSESWLVGVPLSTYFGGEDALWCLCVLVGCTLLSAVLWCWVRCGGGGDWRDWMGPALTFGLGCLVRHRHWLATKAKMLRVCFVMDLSQGLREARASIRSQRPGSSMHSTLSICFCLPWKFQLLSACLPAFGSRVKPLNTFPSDIPETHTMLYYHSA